MDYGNSVTALRKYADMLDAQNTVQEATEEEVDEAKEVDESEEQVEEGKLPPALQAHIDAKNESKDEEVDESKDEEVDEAKEADESKDEVDEEVEVDESKDDVDESTEGQWVPSDGQTAQQLLRKYSDMVAEASKDKDEEVREEKADDEE